MPPCGICHSWPASGAPRSAPAAADEHLAGGVDQRDAGAGAVARMRRRAHGLARAARSGRAITSAETGASAKPLAAERLRPRREAVERRGQGAGDHDRRAAPARDVLGARERGVDGVGAAVGDDVGAARLQVEAGGEVAGLAERRAAVVEIEQPAPRDLRQRRRDSASASAVNFAPR